MLRVAVGRLSTPHGATWSPEPRTHVGHELSLTRVRFPTGYPPVIHGSLPAEG